MTTEDRRVGKLLPSPVTPPDTVCYTIRIPNAVQYRAAFLGQIGILGSWQTWDHPTDGTVCVDCEEAAQLFRTAIYEANWSDDCEIDMSCDDVTDCIETNEGTQAAITALASQIVPLPAPYPLGTPNPSPNTDIASGTNVTCDPDITWAQCIAIVDKTHATITDVLEKIEAATNSVELADALSEFPVVGWAKDLAGVQIAMDLANYYQEALAEQYAAQYTETVRDQMACELFCACQDDCQVTLQRVYDVFETRLKAYITVPDLDDLVNIIEFIAGVNQDTTIVVDLAFFAAWGMAKLGSFFFGPVYDKTFELIVNLAVNDASNDWTLLCEDCPDTWSKTWNFVEGDVVGWDIAVGSYVASVGFQNVGSGDNPYTVDIGRDITWPSGSALTGVAVGASSTAADGAAFRGVYYPSGGGAAQTGYTSNVGDYDMSFVANNPTPPRIEVQVSNNTVPGANVIRFVTLSGTGTEPTWD